MTDEAWPWTRLTATVAAVTLGLALLLIRSYLRRDKQEPQQSYSPNRLSPPASPLLGLKRGRSRRAPHSGAASTDPHLSDPPLLQKHSNFRSYTTSQATYPSIRTFYRLHPQRQKIPSKPTPLPLLVFVHGLGGSVAQFKPLLTSLIDVASCLSIDLPGCGRSAFAPTTWSAYSVQALVKLLQVVISEHLEPDQQFVLIGHSLGTLLSALVASMSSPISVNLVPRTVGVIGICPPAGFPSGRQKTFAKFLLALPSPFFDVMRAVDRIGGVDSKSVRRFVGANASLDLRKMQLRFNTQSKTPVYRRMAWSLLSLDKDWPDFDLLRTWSRVAVPVFLVAGDADHVTKVNALEKISRVLGRKESVGPQKPSSAVGKQHTLGPAAAECDPAMQPLSKSETTLIESAPIPAVNADIPAVQYARKDRVLKTTIFPAPAAHALLYDPSTSRTLSGLIQTFLHEHVDLRLSLGWQLQHLTTEAKWDVKNLQKWQGVAPVSEPIAGIFRAMKTLREVDEQHTPARFASVWSKQIKAVVDISHESPVYDPKGLDDRGLEYHKFPSVSKIPPSVEEVADFNKLIDHLRFSSARGAPPSDSSSVPDDPATNIPRDGRLIGVHCHYGFNRTGFFICSYLVEVEGHTVQAAIDEFARQRPPGIRHAHFLDELSVRYYEGLRQAPTM